MTGLYTGSRSAMEHDGLEAETLNTDPGHAELLNICEINQRFIYKAASIR